MHSKMKTLFKSNYVEQILVSVAFCTVDLTLWNKILISNILTFSDSDSLQAFRRKLKQFFLSVELKYLEILK